MTLLRDEPNWLSKLRLNSLDHYCRIIKKDNEENFDKYLGNKSYINTNPAFKKSDFMLQINEHCLSGIKHQVDSQIVIQKFFKESESKGVVFCSLENACRNYEKIFKKHFGKLISPDESLISSFSSAFWSGGTFIYVPPNVSIEVPFQVSCYINCGDFAQIERSLIILDRNSNLNINEFCSSSKVHKNLFHLLVSEIFIDKNAKINFKSVKNWSNNTASFSRIKVNINENGTFLWNKKVVNGKVVNDRTEVVLSGNNAKYEQKNISLANYMQNHVLDNLVEHKHPKSSSSIVTKTILKSRSSVITNNSVIVQKGATESKSFVKCDGIIDGKDAIYRSTPNIVSYENQAEINHESTLGKIDEDQLFYLQTKGLTELEARNMITLGFLGAANSIDN